MSTRLDERLTEPDWLVQALVVVAVALYVAGAGWLISAEIGDAGTSHRAAVHVDNQTHLTLEVEIVDRHGGRLTLGAHQPGASSRLEVADVGPSWTFETFYGHREVDWQTLDRATLDRQGWTVHIPATATADLERAGYQ
jgi:hypothetical protein